MKKSTSYRETFRSHRLLLILPIVIATVIGGWFVLGAPKSYESSGSLWVDTPGSTSSSLDDLNPSLTPPSQEEQSTLTELLSTSTFDMSVAHQSTLAKYLASDPSNGFGPTALLSKLSSGGKSTTTQIISYLGPKHVMTSVPGPQVLEISYFGPTPAVAQSTLQAIIHVLQQDSARFLQQHNQAALGFNESQVQTARQALVSARNQENAYLQQHHDVGQGDPTMASLTAAVTAANNQLSQATAALNADNTANAGAGSAQIIDEPSFPAGPTSGKKKEIEGVLGGMIAGLLISLLGTIALTRGKADPWEDELEEGRTRTSEKLAVAGAADSAHPAPSLVAARNVNPTEAHKVSGSLTGGHRRFVRGSRPGGEPTG